MQQSNGLFHADQSGCHKRRKSDQMNILFQCTIHNRLVIDIFSQVNDFVTIVFQQNFYDIFSNIVNVALNRCHNDFSLGNRLRTRLGKVIFNDFKASLCNTSCQNQLRQKNFPGFKRIPGSIQRRNQNGIDNFHWIGILQQFLSQLCAFSF